MWEIRYVDRKTREIIVIRRVTEFASARTIAVNVPRVEGKNVVIHKLECKRTPRYDV